MNGNMNFNPYQNNGMNPNMNQQMGMNPNMNNGMQQAPMIDPLAQEKKEKRTKLFKRLAIFLVIFLILLFGKKYISCITVDYKSVVDEALSNYYISTNVSDLEPITELLNKYKKNAKIVKNIQNYSYEQIANWYFFIDKKYKCDENNLNSCVVQLQEFQLLNVKIKALKEVKGGGYFIILPNAYDELLNSSTTKITSLTSATRNKNYTSPDNSEAIYQKKCSSVNVDNDCDCRDGTCTCSYTYTDNNGSKKVDEIKCYKPETIKEK